MLKAFKKDILLAMKQGQKFQKQTMGISLQYVIIVVKNITLKNLLSQKEKDIFVVVIVTQNIEPNCCPKKNNTLMAQGIRKKNEPKEKRQEKYLIIM